MVSAMAAVLEEDVRDTCAAFINAKTAIRNSGALRMNENNNTARFFAIITEIGLGAVMLGVALLKKFY